jgi:hypothetical protein
MSFAGILHLGHCGCRHDAGHDGHAAGAAVATAASPICSMLVRRVRLLIAAAP